MQPTLLGIVISMIFVNSLFCSCGKKTLAKIRLSWSKLQRAIDGVYAI